MSQTLVIYSTVDGQTKAICQKIKEINVQMGHDVTLVPLTEAKKMILNDFDKILIGASIRYGKHRAELYSFIDENYEVLASKVSGFFTVNVVARKPGKNTPETNPYMIKFLQLSSWRPRLLGVFAGKIDYPKYGFFDRFMIRFIMKVTKGPTDTKGTFEFTDWEQVNRFAEDFSKQ
ncbi:menaquinone-dependent protoporphyrinogen IX dehydrogenase [Shewanella surugensis]|uniref:Protoporphyrinogen IX dehydrogenase [quinone] n=1 Tax=Shewanella surugensis TaxID=212020 RepID=A0ABT0LCC8_9GAMM|nr:menaquinone-dependent protoporphyrinogen IX dehydrogenase [Shewanella surugensis]MCL1125348.1 menaquinone-dependent protoporphyrinogen IX dehydrogenase [Shewanella surugensis]